MKVDLKKEYKNYFSAKPQCVIDSFGTMNYITVTGTGEPRGEEFTKAVKALYTAAYGVKNHCKNQGNDFVVPPLEGLWWVNSSTFFMDTPRSQWQWKLMIMIPEFVTAKIFKITIEETQSKKKNIALSGLKFEKINEGKCIQVLHIGSYQMESETIKMMDEYLKENHFERNGHHHEIYLSDPNKVAAAKMKTILRQPVK